MNTRSLKQPWLHTRSQIDGFVPQYPLEGRQRRCSVRPHACLCHSNAPFLHTSRISLHPVSLQHLYTPIVPISTWLSRVWGMVTSRSSSPDGYHNTSASVGRKRRQDEGPDASRKRLTGNGTAQDRSRTEKEGLIAVAFEKWTGALPAAKPHVRNRPSFSGRAPSTLSTSFADRDAAVLTNTKQLIIDTEAKFLEREMQSEKLREVQPRQETELYELVNLSLSAKDFSTTKIPRYYQARWQRATARRSRRQRRIHWEAMVTQHRQKVSVRSKPVVSGEVSVMVIRTLSEQRKSRKQD